MKVENGVMYIFHIESANEQKRKGKKQLKNKKKNKM